MTPLTFTLVVFGISVFAGIFGAVLGLGGGAIVVPALTLLPLGIDGHGVDIRYAIGASIVSIIATSSGAAAAYVRERLTNLRVAMLLELGTTSGALSGAYLAGLLSGRWLYLIFGSVIALSVVQMLRKIHAGHSATAPPDRLADRLRLHATFHDPATGEDTPYRVTRTWAGLILMYVAGIMSGLLGIGSGILKVPAMDVVMGLPIKVSTATSNLMIGVTAATSAGVYFARGDVDPFIAAPVAAGVLLGAFIGARLLGRLHSGSIRIAFVLVLLVAALQMLWKGLHG